MTPQKQKIIIVRSRGKKNNVDLCSSIVAAVIGIFLFIWALKN